MWKGLWLKVTTEKNYKEELIKNQRMHKLAAWT